MILNYQATLLEAKQEIAVVVLGPFMNVLVFSLLVFFAWVIPKFMGLLPDLGSKFIMAYGIMTFFDPILVMIVDCCLGVSISLSYIIMIHKSIDSDLSIYIYLS